MKTRLLHFFLTGWLLLAGMTGLAGPYSLNLQGGRWYLIANQLDNGGNTLNQVLPGVPDGSILLKFDDTLQVWTPSSVYSTDDNAWLNGNTITLVPGEGAAFRSPVNCTLTFTGNTHTDPGTPRNLAAGKLHLVSRRTDAAGNYDTIVGASPDPNCQAWLFNGGFSAYIFDEFDLQWSPSDWATGVGVSVFIRCGAGSSPLPIPDVSCPPNRTVECGSAWTFDSPNVTGYCGTHLTFTAVTDTTNAVSCLTKYTRVWEFTDACSNRLTCSQSVSVVYPAPYAFNTLAGTADQLGASDGAGAAARFNYPSGIAVDAAGKMYVADHDNHTVRKITPDGTVTTFAGSPGQSGAVDGTGSAARFSGPNHVAVDGAGNVYVVENNTVRKITPGAVVTTLAGSPGQGGNADGIGSAARFYLADGIAVDAAGNVYVADTGNNTIRMVTPAGLVTTLAGSPGHSGSDDGTGAAASFNNPNAIAVDSAGNLYVADRSNSTIRKLTPVTSSGNTSWIVTTLAGKALINGSDDGSGDEARFNWPEGVAVNSAGDVYVCDRYNHLIRKITPQGYVTTLAGRPGFSGSADGTGSAARFNYPEAITVDSAGNVYVADENSHTIRKGVLAGPNLICASNKTVNCTTLWDFDPPSVSDSCSGTNLSMSILGTVTSGVCPLLITRTWSATDSCGNSNMCSQTVTVVNTSLPVFTNCPPPILNLGCNPPSIPDCYPNVRAINGCGTVTVPSYLLVSSVGSAQVKRYNATTGAFIDNFSTGGGLTSPSGLAYGSDGNLYVSSGGTHSVLRYNGVTGAFMDTFVPTGSGGLGGTFGLTFGPDGNLYVSSLDPGTWSVKRYAACNGGFIDTFVAVSSGGLSQPIGLTFGPDANLYVSSYGTSQVKRYNGTTGVFLDDFASGNGLAQPTGLVFGPDGNLYVSSYNSVSIKRYNGTTGTFIDTFASGGGLDHPSGLAFGPDGNLYVSSNFSDEVKVYSGATGAFLGNFVSAGSGGLSGPSFLIFTPTVSAPQVTHSTVDTTNGCARTRTITYTATDVCGNSNACTQVISWTVNPSAPVFTNCPAPVLDLGCNPISIPDCDPNVWAVDTCGQASGAGDLLVCSYYTDSVNRYDGTTGVPKGVFASGGGLIHPSALTFGPDGNLYVTGEGPGSKVTRFDGRTGVAMGTFVAGSDINGAFGLAFGPDGNLYVSSGYDNLIRRYSRLDGTPMGSFSSYRPSALTFGADSKLYVGGFIDHDIKRYDAISGTFLNVFVSTTPNGPNGPYDLEFGPDGHLYVASQSSAPSRYNRLTGDLLTAYTGGPLSAGAGVAVGPDGNVYVSSFYNSRVLRYNRTTGEFMDEFIPAGAGGLDHAYDLTFMPSSISVACTKVDTTNGCAHTRTITYTAVDACGNSNTCTQVIDWTVSTVATVLTTCVTNSLVAGNLTNNFAGSNAASPSANLVSWLATNQHTVLRGFDGVCEDDHFFAHTFTRLPSCITSAKLRVRIRACSNNADNDGIWLAFADASGVAGANIWSSYIGSTYGGIFVTNTPWTSGKTAELTLDLAALPATGGAVDFLHKLNDLGYLDLVVQDETAVDYAVLDLTSCCSNVTVACGTEWGFSPPTATGGCCTNFAITLLSAQTNGVCPKVVTAVWQAVDCCAIAVTSIQIVTVVDTIPPVITATGTTLSLGCNPSALAINSALGTATATDNCDNVTPTPSDSTVTGTGCGRSQTRTWNVTDACGNAATPVSRTVTWTEDITPPVISQCPSNILVCGTNGTGLMPDLTALVQASDACGTVQFSQNVLSGTVLGLNAAWTATGSMQTNRAYFTATLLLNGKVLATGGYRNNQGEPTSSAELYNPATATWTMTGAMSVGRLGHTAMLLPNGKVLVAGGHAYNAANPSSPLTLSSAELYDPATGTWSATGSMNAARYQAAATLLPNGKVLIAGGVNPSGYLSSAELYDPGTGTWTETGPMSVGRWFNKAVLLKDGRVLAAGGYANGHSLASAELYDPASETWSITGTMHAARTYQTLTVLLNGTVIAAGGSDDNGPLASAEVFNPTSGTWTLTAGMNYQHAADTATLLPIGKVLVAGAADSVGHVLASAELFDPATGSWTTTIPMNTSRSGHSATLLPNGKVLVMGGSEQLVLSSAELYAPDTTGPLTVTITATDGCGNSSQCSSTVALVSSPFVLTCVSNKTVQCSSNWSFDPPSATDACCGPVNMTTLNTTTNGTCPKDIIRTWLATDSCNHSMTCSQKVTVVDTAAPVITATGTTLTLGCNPSAATINDALGTATATDNCSSVTPSAADSSITSSGCNRAQTRTWNVTDACGNPATPVSRTVTWTEDTTPPVIRPTGTTLTLGCSPSAADINNALGTATATDNCGSVTPTASDSVVTSTGCTRSQTRTWNATDVCGNSATVSRTVTWSVVSRVAIPGLFNTGVNASGTGLQTIGLADAHWTLATPYPTSGSGLPVPLPSTLTFGPAYNNLPNLAWLANGPDSQWLMPHVTSSPGGNYIYQTTFNIPSGYDPATASISGWWSSDNEGITAWLNNGPLTGFPVPGSASFNVMTPFTITHGISGANFHAGLNTLTFQVRNRGISGIDANATETGIRVQFTASGMNPAPVIIATGTTLSLGCNPGTVAINDALGTATTSGECPATPIATDSTVTINGCGRSQTRTWNATDPCGNAAAPVSRTVTWTLDTTLPVITAIGATLNLGCNPSAAAINSALGTATASDNCGNVTPTATDSSVTGFGCNRSQTRTWNVTDACGNAATPVSRTITWTEDTIPPVIVASGTSLILGCNPSAAAINNALGTATATDNCGSVTPTATDSIVTSTGCGRSQTRTWNVTDACGNPATPVSRTVTWTEDTTGPIVTCRSNSITVPFDANCRLVVPRIEAIATDGCTAGQLTPVQSPPVGAIIAASSVKVTVTAMDTCGNSSSCTVLVIGQGRTGPVLSGPSDIVITDCLVPCVTNLVMIAPNCCPVSSMMITQSPPCYTPFGPGIDSVQVTVTDCNGNSSTKVIALTYAGVGSFLTELYNTGVDINRYVLSEGLADTHYALPPVSVPVGTTYSHSPDPAAVTSPWDLDSSVLVSRWIAPAINSTSANLTYQPDGTYTYKLTFTLPAVANASSATISGRWAADNRAGMYLNSVAPANLAASITSADGSKHWYDFNILPGKITPGPNTILFVVTNSTAGSRTSSWTGLRVEFTNAFANCNFCTPPVLASDSKDQTLPRHGTAVFTASPQGTPPFSYQWYLNAVALRDSGNASGVTSANLKIEDIASRDAGLYSVVVTNPCGSATQTFRLTVTKENPRQMMSGSPGRGPAPPPSGLPAWGWWMVAQLDYPLAATYGPDLILVGTSDYGTNLTLSTGTSLDFGLPSPGGNSVNVMHVSPLPADTSLQVPVIAPDGSQSVRSYTLIMDLFQPAVASGFSNTLFSSAGQGLGAGVAITLDAQNKLHIVGAVDGVAFDAASTAQLPVESWNRLAVVMNDPQDAEDVKLDLYLNGQAVTNLTLAVTNGLPISWAVDPPTLLSRHANEINLNGAFFLSTVQFHARALTPETIASIGSPDNGPIPGSDPDLGPQPVLLASLSDGKVNLSWLGTPYVLQETSDLASGIWLDSILPFTQSEVGDDILTLAVADPALEGSKKFYRLAFRP